MLLTAALGVLGVASGALAARMAELQIVLIPVSLASLALGHAGLTGAVGGALDAPLRVELLQSSAAHPGGPVGGDGLQRVLFQGEHMLGHYPVGPLVGCGLTVELLVGQADE